MNRCLRLIAALLLASAVPSLFAQSTSHPTLRPLPEISQRPLGNGPNFFVDPVKGNDAAAGSEVAPWRTINHALKLLNAGDTLVLPSGAATTRWLGI